MIAVLTGGTGGAKFVEGLHRVVPGEQLTCIVNTGDDFKWWGLHISPDLDSITYALAGRLSPERGWGIRDDTFFCLETMRELGEPSWFQTGDRDLGQDWTPSSSRTTRTRWTAAPGARKGSSRKAARPYPS